MAVIGRWLLLRGNCCCRLYYILMFLTHFRLTRLPHIIYCKSQISILGMSGYMHMIQIFLEKMAKLCPNSGDTDQMPRSAASDLGLHCLLITLLGDSRLKWIKYCIMQDICKMLAQSFL